LICEDFGYAGRIKKLPHILKFAPQHLISDGERIRLVFYKPSYDDRYIELTRDEITSIRTWNSNIHRVIVFIFNYKANKYTVFTMDEINKKMFTCKKETINNFLFNNTGFTWYNVTDKLELGLYGR
jgi:hypothetical protein